MYMNKEKIGCIGQGWIGKNYADDFERRGFDVVRYALEEPYVGNKEAIAACDLVFIAVPTPTTKEGFDASYIENVLPLIGEGKIAVIKSTIIPGTTELLQKKFPNIYVVHSPEFLREATAAFDAANPERNIIGLPEDTESYRDAATKVLSVLPPASFSRVMPARSAELVKYAGNVFLAMKVVYANLLYDFSSALGIEYDDVREAVGADPRIGISHLNPVNASGHNPRPGRGAGGHCFIKDYEAFRLLYEEVASIDTAGAEMLRAIAKKNNVLLTASGKDFELLRAVYGTEHPLLP
jgi:UDPglucose 6-dehydrogenase